MTARASIRRQFARVTLLVASAIVALVGAAGPARAQIDPMSVMDITQQGVVVGQIYVPAYASPTDYVEHWVLFPGYAYPSSTSRFVTEITASDHRYDSTEQFLREVPFPAGTRYVRVSAHDTDSLPSPGEAVGPTLAGACR
jgi:hypothetical protein